MLHVDIIRDGQLCFDIGWVGVVTAKSKIADDRWHQVAVNWRHSDHRLRMYVDGKLDGEGSLARLLDEVRLVPGYDYSERAVGTTAADSSKNGEYQKAYIKAHQEGPATGGLAGRLQGPHKQAPTQAVPDEKGS